MVPHRRSARGGRGVKRALAGVLALAACAADAPTPAEHARVGIDAEEQRECVDRARAHLEAGAVDRAGAWTEADACRAAVRARRDGGAP